MDLGCIMIRCISESYIPITVFVAPFSIYKGPHSILFYIKMQKNCSIQSVKEVDQWLNIGGLFFGVVHRELRVIFLTYCNADNFIV